MPTYKHPCPHCGQYIARDVVACPFCGAKDPFVPGRCPSCRTPIEDPRWVVCPKCGAAVGAAAVAQAAAVAGTAATATGAPEAAPATGVHGPAPAMPARPEAPAATRGPAPAGATCAGCGSALREGARFCLVCGMLVG